MIKSKNLYSYYKHCKADAKKYLDALVDHDKDQTFIREKFFEDLFNTFEIHIKEDLLSSEIIDVIRNDRKGIEESFDLWLKHGETGLKYSDLIVCFTLHQYSILFNSRNGTLTYSDMDLDLYSKVIDIESHKFLYIR